MFGPLERQIVVRVDPKCIEIELSINSEDELDGALSLLGETEPDGATFKFSFDNPMFM